MHCTSIARCTRVTFSCGCQKAKGTISQLRPIGAVLEERALTMRPDTGHVDETNPGPGAPTHLDEAALDDVCCAQPAPQVLREAEGREPFGQVTLQPQALVAQLLCSASSVRVTASLSTRPSPAGPPSPIPHPVETALSIGPFSLSGGKPPSSKNWLFAGWRIQRIPSMPGRLRMSFPLPRVPVAFLTPSC
jgi:hypothetical protein